MCFDLLAQFGVVSRLLDQIAEPAKPVTHQAVSLLRGVEHALDGADHPIELGAFTGELLPVSDGSA
jgi:hypothetical protein